MTIDRRTLAGALLGGALLVSAASPQATLASSSSLVINEIDYDQPSTDTAEFVELRNVSEAPIGLAGYALDLRNGNAGGSAQYRLVALPDVTLAAGDYYVVCGNSANVPNCDLDVTPDTDLIQNGAPDAVALVQGSTIVDTVSYEGDTGAPYTEASGAGVLDDAVGTKSISRCADGSDTDQNNLDFSLRVSTPGAANACADDLPPTVLTTSPANGATGISTSASLAVQFSEDVTLGAGAVALTCSVSGPHAVVVSGGPQDFVADPQVDFAFGESCMATVVAAQVQDLDGTPNSMATDVSFAFTTTLQPLGACGDPATPIHAVQGSGATSPLNGTSGVTIEGVVTGDYQASGQLGGYFVQEADADADADPATSEGLFVFDSASAVVSGDRVRVRGRVTEFLTTGVTLTELTNVTDVQVCSSGHGVTPRVVSLPVGSLGDWEALEGMLVEIPQTLTVTETFTLARFGEVSLSADGRLLNPTAVTTPGANAVARQELNDRSRILLDDGDGRQNIDPTLYPTGGLSASNTLRSGDSVSGLTGVLEQRFGVYRIQPIGPVPFSADNARPGDPPAVGGRLRVGAMNVLNYFTTLDTNPGSGNGPDICGPNASLECRGANDAVELGRQRAKIVSAITGLDADVLGLMEVENNATAAIQDLVNAVNAEAAPGQEYAFVDTGTIGTDAIKVALIYRPTRVTATGAHKVLDSSVDPEFIDTLNRPVLAQTFAEAGSGERFTIAVAHLKSKGSDCNAVGDPDTGDGQGNCNVTRTRAAAALNSWLAADPTHSGDSDFLIVGDLNSYAFEDPITTLEAGGYANLIERFAGPEGYSYVFDGQSGYLDHALASGSLGAQVKGAAEWHINADEPIALDYNVEFKTPNQVTTFYDAGPYRASDHDPLVVGLDLDQTPPTLQVAVFPRLLLLPVFHQYVPVRGFFQATDNSGVPPVVRLVSVTSSEPDDAPGPLDGATTNDIVILSDTFFALRSERALDGPGRVYTITYEATDAAGNTARAQAISFVPNFWQ